jgi:hypothetical protein
MPASDELENLRLIFKFSDGVYLPDYPDLFKWLEKPKGFETELEKFVDSMQIKKLLVSTDVLAQFEVLLEEVKKQLGLQPSYAFKYCPMDVFNQLMYRLEDAVTKKKNVNGFVTLENALVPYTMPNFYLCFQYILPRGSKKSEYKKILARFDPFLPIAGKNGGEQSLLEYAYLKYDAIEAADRSLSGVIRELNGNQNYFKNMDIRADLIPTLEGDEICMGIIEKNGWYLGHSEFGNLSGRYTLLMNPSAPYADILAQRLLAGDENAHGTKILGVLISKENGTDPDCRGLLPPRTKLVLSSQKVALKPYISPAGILSLQRLEHINDEENAFLRILDFYCRQGYENQVILFEIQVPLTNFPMTTEPLFRNLIKCAFRLGHIVILAAGNGSSSTPLATKLGRAFPAFAQSCDHCILVGAADTTVYPIAVQTASNWQKNCVRFFAQGHNILTTDQQDLKYHTTSSTSGASAIIAGVVGLLQSFARHKINRPLFPEELIQILINSGGTPVYKRDATGTVTNEVVGIIPNVSEAMRRIERLNPNNPTP